MQRQRGGLVPIGEALADLGGPVKAIREASPQALHHFTRFDQVNQLVAASEADADLGFMARTMALCSLPRTNPGDRLTAESDPAFEAFAAYLDTGSLRDAYRQRSGKAQATAAPGAWTGWSTKYNWVSRRAAFVEFTVRECQDATQLGLVQIRRRFIDTANTLLDDGSVPAVRAASRVIVENFPAVAKVAVSDERIEDLSDIPDADLDRMKEIRDAARAKAQAKVSDGRDAARGKNEQTNLEE